MNVSPSPKRAPSLIVEDKNGDQWGVVIAQHDPFWKAPENLPDRGLSPANLLRRLPHQRNDPPPEVVNYPTSVANPFAMIGRNADILVPATPPIPARVTAFHGAIDLTFSMRRVRVRELLELEVRTVSSTYYDLFIEKDAPQKPPSPPRLAGRLVTTTAPVQHDGKDESQLIGLIIGGIANRLIVVPVSRLLSAEECHVVPPVIMRREMTPIELTVRTGMDSNLSNAMIRQGLRAVNVERRIRNGFLNTIEEVGFYDDEADVSEALANFRLNKVGG